jgi:hypothetical protein
MINCDILPSQMSDEALLFVNPDIRLGKSRTSTIGPCLELSRVFNFFQKRHMCSVCNDSTRCRLPI